MSCHRFASLCLLAGVLPACASPRAAAPIAPVQAAVDSVFARDTIAPSAAWIACWR
ncbi:MAG TPA: hypothetical protein VIP80_08245 [Gemmatimonadales bacterium]